MAKDPLVGTRNSQGRYIPAAPARKAGEPPVGAPDLPPPAPPLPGEPGYQR